MKQLGMGMLLALATTLALGQDEGGDELDFLFATDSPEQQPSAGESAAEPGEGETDAPAPEDSAAEEPEPYPESIAVGEQPAEPPAPAPTADSGGRRIEEIIVTATKRSRSTRDLPVSIDAFTGAELEERGATGLEEILKYSPGVMINEDGEGENAQITIRGINTDTLGSSRNRTFGVFLEDTSILNPSYRGPQPQFDPFDMQTVEVLKGPQGTLFGGSALAGAIRYVPNPADFKGTYGKLGAGWTRIDEADALGTRYSGMFNLPVNDRLAFRVAGTLSESPGYVDDPRRGLTDINSGGADTLRGLISAQPTENLYFSATHLKRSYRQDDGRRLSGPEDRYEINNRRDPDESRSEVTVTNLKLEWALDRFDLIGLYNRVKKDGYVHTDISIAVAVIAAGFLHDNGAGNLGGINMAELVDSAVEADVINELDLTSDQPAWELRLLSTEPTDGWGWQALKNWDVLLGLYSMSSDQLYYQIVTGGPGALVAPPPELAETAGLRTNSDGELQPESYIFIFDGVTTERAAYFDLTRSFGRFEINLGGRFFDINPEVEILTSAVDSNTVEPQPDPASDGPLLQQEQGFNPKLALTWQPGERYSVFAAAAKGFRFGGVNSGATPNQETNPFPLTYDSDSLWNYEIGLRTDWLDHKLLADLTLFYVDWSDLQIEQNYGEYAYVYLDNVGRARSQGLEFSTRALLPWGFGLMANGAYIDARTTEDFSSDSGDVPRGARLPSAPYFSSSVVVNWIGEFERWTIGANLAWAYSADSPSSLDADPEMIASYSTWNGGLRLAAPGLPLKPEFNLTVTNIPNDFIVLYESAGQLIKVAGQPRTITAGLTLNF